MFRLGRTFITPPVAGGKNSYLQSQHLGNAQYVACPTYVKLDLFGEPAGEEVFKGRRAIKKPAPKRGLYRLEYFGIKCSATRWPLWRAPVLFCSAASP